MKKLFIILFLCTLSLVSYSQRHIFENNQEANYENGEWGRWVRSLDDILVSGTSSGYTLKFYPYGKSTPDLSLDCFYEKMDGSWYVYKVTSIKILGKASYTNITLKTSTKLSSMANGAHGSLNMWIGHVGLAYSCKN